MKNVHYIMVCVTEPDDAPSGLTYMGRLRKALIAAEADFPDDVRVSHLGVRGDRPRTLTGKPSRYDDVELAFDAAWEAATT